MKTILESYQYINLIATTGEIAPTFSLSLVIPPEAPEIGQPGKNAGDLLLVKYPSTTDLLVSLGNKAKLKADTFRQVGGLVAKWLRQNTAPTITLQYDLFKQHEIPGAFAAFCEGLFLGAFTFNKHKSDTEKESRPNVHINATSNLALVKLEIKNLWNLTAAVNLARDWAHEPANVINPISLAERTAALAKQLGLKCTILDEIALEKLGAGAILAVGQGSKTPSRLIILEYPGISAHPEDKPVVLVGKALTFDSGGYSLKSTENIVGMKYDKCGGVTVIATLAAAVLLGVKTPLVGIIGASENMVSAQAYRPDDIIVTLSKKTVEIISTDAEGRLVLADALTYAQQKFSPRAIIDLATLTGGVVVALGKVRAGLMANNEELALALFEAGESTYERLWQLPMDEEYAKAIKGDDADIKNSGGREAQSISGGMFLREFVDDRVPWAHLDIAGLADSNKDSAYIPKGSSGFGVRLLIEYLETLEK